MTWKLKMIMHFTTLFVIVLSFLVSIYLFASGFLLTRQEMNITSVCSHSDIQDDLSTRACWTVPNIGDVYKKVILIVIDALRIDFALNSPENTEKNDLPYKNKLKVFRDLAQKYGCDSVRLFRFRADAPTTTMQRIKGLTTGSFPTFIDVSSNFDSSEITEDNLIDQFINSNKGNITFLGDDTWTKLFPGRFSPAYAFPSFDVKDLHLVDDGIIQHLVPELKSKQWKMLIAHFLGVDHCGHRYGPLHQEMALKLLQMDSVIRSVVQNMENDTLLLVMGDHGMTQTGDHGGETMDEIDSALFAFSPIGKFAHSEISVDENCHAGLVHQIDLVPTLSLLVGTSIPFSNLGSIIEDLMPKDSIDLKYGDTSSNLLKALVANANQIKTYLQEYNNKYDNFNSPKFAKLMESLEGIQKNKVHAKEIKMHLHAARDLCKAVWAHFNKEQMTLGLFCFTATCVWLICNKSLYQKTALFGFFGSCLSFLTLISLDTTLQIPMLIIIITVLTLSIVYVSWKTKVTVIGLIYFCYPLLYTSNSFVLSEDSMSLYLFFTALGLLSIYVAKHIYSPVLLKQMGRHKKSSKAVWKLKQSLSGIFSNSVVFLCFVLATIMCLLRMVYLFRICRPEQHWCFSSEQQNLITYLEPNTTFSVYYIERTIDFSDPWTRLFVSGGSLSLILLVMGLCLKKEGNLRNSYSAARICCTKLLPLVSICIVLNWQIHCVSVQDLKLLPELYITFLPRCAYVLLLLCILFWFISPLTTHLMYQDRFGQYRDDVLTKEEALTACFQQLRRQLLHNSIETTNNMESRYQATSNLVSQPPAAFGLYTLLSAAVVGFGEVVIILLAVLLEEKYAPVLLVFILTVWAFLEIVSSLKQRSNMEDVKVSWDVVGIWMLSSSFWWFVTGHQASLSSIPWNAAFVGFQGSHPTVVLPGLMVGANVFSSQILHTVFLPLLLLWPITRGNWFLKVSSVKKNVKDKSDQESTSKANPLFTSELDFLQSNVFWDHIADLFYKHILLHALKTLGCMSAAFMHRRHLMVWQIFAPRLMYEALSFFVVCVTSLIMFAFIARVHQALNNWIKKIT